MGRVSYRVSDGIITGLKMLGKDVKGWQLDRPGSGQCQMADFGTNGSEPWHSR